LSCLILPNHPRTPREIRGESKHDNGDNLSFLGLNIRKEKKNGVITISQPAFIEDILEGWDIKEVAATPRDSCRPRFRITLKLSSLFSSEMEKLRDD
jgi:hypothetical protein